MNATDIPPFNDLWKGYRQNVMPDVVHETQEKETKRAFFAGGVALMTLMLNQVAELDQEESEKAMMSLNKQFKGFAEAVRIGQA